MSFNPTNKRLLIPYDDFFDQAIQYKGEDNNPLRNQLIDLNVEEILLLVGDHEDVHSLNHNEKVTFTKPTSSPAEMLSSEYTFKAKLQEQERDIDLERATWDEMNDCAFKELEDMTVMAQLDLEDGHNGNIDDCGEDTKEILAWWIPDIRFVEAKFEAEGGDGASAESKPGNSAGEALFELDKVNGN